MSILNLEMTGAQKKKPQYLVRGCSCRCVVLCSSEFLQEKKHVDSFPDSFDSSTLIQIMAMGPSLPFHRAFAGRRGVSS